MERLICAVVLGCLAIASAIPLPEQGLASEEDFMKIILNADPEDNDIFNPTDSLLPENDTVTDEFLNKDSTHGQLVASGDTTVPEPSQETPESVTQVYEDQGGADPVEPEPLSPAENPEEPQPETMSDDDLIPTELKEELEKGSVIMVSFTPLEAGETPTVMATDEQLVTAEIQEDPRITELEDSEIIVVPSEEVPQFPLVYEEVLPESQSEGQMSESDEDVLHFIQQESGVQVSEPEGNEGFSEATDVSEEEPREPEYISATPQSGFKYPLFHPLYFDEMNDPTYLFDEYLPGMPDDQMPLFVSSDMTRDQPIKPDVFIPSNGMPVNEERDDYFFDDSVFYLSPPLHEFADYEPEPEVLGVYYPPEGNFAIGTEKDEHSEMETGFVNQEEVILELDPMSEFFAVESSPQAFTSPASDSSIQGEINSENEPSVLDYEFPDVEKIPFQSDKGQVELEETGTILVAEEQSSPDENEPSLDIIQLEDPSSSRAPVPPETLLADILENHPYESPSVDDLENDTQQITTDEQIVELTGDEATPLVLEEAFWFPEEDNQHPIIFPEEAPAHNILPVFPSQGQNGEIPDAEESEIPKSPLYDEISSTGSVPVSEYPYPPAYPQKVMEQEFPTAFSMQTDEMPSEDLEVMLSSDIPLIPRDEIVSIFDDDREYMGSGHIHLPEVVIKGPRYSSFRKRFNRPAFYGMPPVVGIAFQQDYQGPNMFPINFRKPDFRSQVSGPYFTSYQDLTPQRSNQENIFFNNPYTSQNFPKALSDTPNMFSGVSEPFQMFVNANNQDTTFETTQNSPTLVASDTQVSFVPYGNSNSIPSYSQNGLPDIRFSYTQQDMGPTYNTQGFSYNVPAYGRSNQLPGVGFYSSPFPENRYDVHYNYGGRDGYYSRYNYPVGTW